MESLTTVAIFLLGASAGALVVTIRFQNEFARFRCQLESLLKDSSQGRKIEMISARDEQAVLKIESPLPRPARTS